jgi:hypothetical protein
MMPRIADCPSAHSATTSKLGPDFSSDKIRRRAGASSSTIRVRIFIQIISHRVWNESQRQGNSNRYACIWRIPELERLFFSI